MVNMYSTKGDTVVDPFLGTGTTMWAAMTSGRNCVGFEIENAFRKAIFKNMNTVIETSNDRIQKRIQSHLDYLEKRADAKDKFKYLNKHYNFPVMTRQEIELFFNPLENIKQLNGNTIEVQYADAPELYPNGKQRDRSVNGTGALPGLNPA